MYQPSLLGEPCGQPLVPRPSRPAALARRAALITAGYSHAVMCTVWSVLLFFPAAQASAQDEEVGKFEVHEWSFWAIDPTQDLANPRDLYSSAMPGPVETERSRVPKDHKATPISVITFHGQPAAELEVEVQIPSGRALAVWPPARRKNNRLRWLDVKQSVEQFQGARMAPVHATHWFERARALDSLYVKSGARQERFLTYDIELPLTVPLRLEGGPDAYRVVNLSPWELADLIISVPTPMGRRIGRVSSVPAKAAVPATQPEQPSPTRSSPHPPKNPSAPAGTGQITDDQASDDQPTDDQAKNGLAKDGPKTQQPMQDQPGFDQPTESQPNASPANVPPTGPAASAGLPGATEPATEKAASPAGGQQSDVPVAGVEVTMSAPLPADAAELVAVRSQLAAGLVAAGLTAGEAELLASLVSESVLNSTELVVLVRLPQAVADEKLPLVFYPAAAKTVRVPLLLIRKVDPRIQHEIQQLVAQLGSAVYSEREAADKRLRELGRLAIPALKQCLTSPDLEVVLRAERMLLALNESIEPVQQPNNQTPPGGAAIPAAAVQVLVNPPGK